MKQSPDKYQTESDARTLQQHAEITSDPDRHQAAVGHLQDQQQMQQKAITSGKRSMRKKVKQGLSKAFPSDGKTPFQKAATGEKD